MSDRLYTVVDAYTEDDYYFESSEDGHEFEWRKPIVCPHPKEWEEFSMGRHGEVVPFYLPATGRIYRSRSAAAARCDLIRYWGGKAEVLECTPQWVPVEVAKKRRANARVQARIEKKQAEILALDAQLWAVP